MEPDLYEVLQVHPTAEPEVVDAAFRRLSRKYHPDLNSSPEATEVMQRLTAAYEILRDPARRAAYDRERAAARHSQPPVPRPRHEVVSKDERAAEGQEGVELSLLGGLARLGIRWTKRSG